MADQDKPVLTQEMLDGEQLTGFVHTAEGTWSITTDLPEGLSTYHLWWVPGGTKKLPNARVRHETAGTLSECLATVYAYVEEEDQLVQNQQAAIELAKTTDDDKKPEDKASAEKTA